MTRLGHSISTAYLAEIQARESAVNPANLVNEQMLKIHDIVVDALESGDLRRLATVAHTVMQYRDSQNVRDKQDGTVLSRTYRQYGTVEQALVQYLDFLDLPTHAASHSEPHHEPPLTIELNVNAFCIKLASIIGTPDTEQRDKNIEEFKADIEAKGQAWMLQQTRGSTAVESFSDRLEAAKLAQAVQTPGSTGPNQ